MEPTWDHYHSDPDIVDSRTATLTSKSSFKFTRNTLPPDADNLGVMIVRQAERSDLFTYYVDPNRVASIKTYICISDHMTILQRHLDGLYS